MPQFFEKWEGLPAKKQVLLALRAMGDNLDIELDIIYRTVINKFSWINNKIKDAPTPEELAQNAIGAILCGQRTWHYKKERLSTVVIGIVRSWVSNLYRKEKDKKTPSKANGPSAPMRGGKVLRLREPATNIYGEQISELEIPGDGIKDNEENEVVEILLNLLKNDPFLLKYLKCKIDNPSMKASGVAKILGCSVDDIYNGYKRMKRFISRQEEALKEYSLKRVYRGNKVSNKDYELSKLRKEEKS